MLPVLFTLLGRVGAPGKLIKVLRDPRVLWCFSGSGDYGHPSILGTLQQMHCTERLGEDAALAHAHTTFSPDS